MHICLVPSAEFIPPQSHISGIFQLHQAQVLRIAGHDIRVISVRLAHTAPMCARAVALRVAGRNAGNDLDLLSIAKICRLFLDKLARPSRFLTLESVEDFPTLRVEGFYGFRRPSPKTDHRGWVRAGLVAFEDYLTRWGKPDIVHAHNLNPAGLLAREIKRRHSIPYIVTEHSTSFQRGLIPRSLYPHLRSSVEDAAALAVISPALRDVLIQTLGPVAARAVWIPEVIDPEFLARLPSPCAPTASNFTFLAIGELVPKKNHAGLIRAFARSFRRHDAVRLEIAGDASDCGSYVKSSARPEEEALRALAAEMGVDSKVSLLGRLTRPAVLEALLRCHTLVLPSLQETFGVVLIEALAVGRPVIATPCGGPECIVGPEDGLLVPVDDEEALAKALEHHYQTSKNYDPAALRARAIARFGPNRLVRDLLALYRQAVSKISVAGEKEPVVKL
jgi:glycosyltransferase involved in cell wall biosynthesis